MDNDYSAEVEIKKTKAYLQYCSENVQNERIKIILSPSKHSLILP